MTKLLPLLLLALAGCDVIPQLLGAASKVADAAAAGAGVQGGTATGTTQGSTPTPSAGAQDPSANAAAAPTATKTITFDSAKKLEYADIWVDMGDPVGQRALVPFLMKPKDWMLVGCEMTSPTSKHYRFMKVASADGKELPSADIFNRSR